MVRLGILYVYWKFAIPFFFNVNVGLVANVFVTLASLTAIEFALFVFNNLPSRDETNPKIMAGPQPFLSARRKFLVQVVGLALSAVAVIFVGYGFSAEFNDKIDKIFVWYDVVVFKHVAMNAFPVLLFSATTPIMRPHLLDKL